jgi:mannose-6-phosphate isomerase
MPAPYPLLLRPTILEKVWGGRRLESLGKVLPKPGAKYGESWELADMGATSASGAGGGAVRSVIANGELRGKTLHEAMGVWGAGMLWRAPGSESRGTRDFPLLIKFLDAGENLSVQVHPSPAYAAANSGAFLKTECWYIIAADPGAHIYKGIRPEVTRAEFARLARAGDPSLVSAMIALPAVPGECHNLPSGTVHALGAGVLVAEVQTPSDTTYRLYDWGRMGREMHVEQALRCAAFPGEPGHAELLSGMTVGRTREGQTRDRLVTTGFFAVDELRPETGGVVPIGASAPGEGVMGEWLALIVLEGECELVAGDMAFQPVALRRGDTALIPGTISAGTLLAAGENLRVLLASVG